MQVPGKWRRFPLAGGAQRRCRHAPFWPPKAPACSCDPGPVKQGGELDRETPGSLPDPISPVCGPLPGPALGEPGRLEPRPWPATTPGICKASVRWAEGEDTPRNTRNRQLEATGGCLRITFHVDPAPDGRTGRCRCKPFMPTAVQAAWLQPSPTRSPFRPVHKPTTRAAR